MLIEPANPATLEELKKYDTPTVLNCIELFDVRPRHEGFMTGAMKACFPEMGPICAYASTATFESATKATNPDAYSNLGEQVAKMEADLPRPRVVVFQDLDPEPCGATFGEVMCTVYNAFGCDGLITSGGARDLDQVRAIGFPCWSTSVISSHAWCRIVDVHVPVDVCGVTIEPGALIHADCNGVATIPHEIVREVALGCKYLVEAEDLVLGYARGDNPTVEGLREAQGAMRRRFGEIAAQAKKGVRNLSSERKGS